MTSNILSSLVQFAKNEHERLTRGLRDDIERIELRLRAAFCCCNLCAMSAQPQREHESGARVAREWLKYTTIICLVFTLGVGNAWGTPTTIASWGCASYSASTNYNCTGGDANNYSGSTKAYFSSTKAFTTSGTNAYYGSSSGGAVITFKNLNLSGYTNVQITFYSRASQGGNFALSYSTNNGSSWSTGNTSGTLATKNTPKSYSITFPTNSTSINAIKLTHSASSGSLYFGTISITGEVPTITCATSSLTGFTYTEGSGPSTAQNFSVSATYLTNNLTISATDNYEIKKSTDGSYGSSVTLTPSTGTVSSTTINVRLKSGLAAGTRNGTITMSSSPASNKSISLSGSVTSACDAPTGPGNSSISSTGWTAGWTAPASAPGSGYLVAYSSTSTAPGTDVTSTGGSYTVASVAAGTTSKAFTSLTAGNTYYWWVRSNCGSSNYSDWTSATTITLPLITASKTITGLNYAVGSGPSAAQSFTVSAVGLTGNLTVTAPTNFEVCKTSDGEYASSVTLTATGSGTCNKTVSNETVYVRLKTGLAQNSYSGNITISGGGAANNTSVSVAGVVSAACEAPTINSHPTGGVSYNMNVAATALSVTATKNGTGPALTYQWYSNTTNNNTTGSAIDDATSSTYTPPTTATGTKYYYCVVSSGACSTPTNTAAITVNTPSITISQTSRAFEDRKINGGPYEMDLTVSGANLAKDQGIGLAITGTNSGMFAIKNSVTNIAQTSTGTVATTTVTVQYSPTGAGSHSATLTFSSTGATSKTVALSGTGKWEVIWSVNGVETPVLVANSTKPTLPSPAPSSCDATSTTFIGWAKTAWDGKQTQSYIDGLTTDATKVHTSNSTMSAITANGTKYHAVFAKATGGGGNETLTASEITTNFTSAAVAYGDAEKSYTDGSVTWAARFSAVASGPYMQLKSDDNVYIKITAPYTISSVEMRATLTSCSGSGCNLDINEHSNATATISLQTAASSGSTVASGTASNKSITLTKSSGNNTTLYIKVSGATKIWAPITVNYSSISYSDYLTTCCESLGSIGASISWSNGNQATLSWANNSNANSYSVTCKAGGASAGSVGSITGTTTKTCVISSLTAGTTYTITIDATGKSGYCNETQEITSVAPQITASATLTGSDYAEGESGGGTIKSFNVSGVGLQEGNLTFTAPTNFQVSTDGGSTWSTSGGSKTLAVNGTLAATAIKVRLVEGLSQGTYGGASTYITISGGGAASLTNTISIAGTVSSACSVPSIGVPTLTSIASGAITVQCPTISGGANCDVDDYGFVWKKGSEPTISDNQTQKGTNNQSTEYSDALTIDVDNNTGSTYYFKAYAHNSAGNNVSASSLAVTPQKVTFNSNGGSAVAAVYLNNGSTVSKPSDPTQANYDFDDWYTDNGTWNSKVSFPATITSDQTYYAHWTEKLHDVTVAYKCGATSLQSNTTIENVGVVTTGTTTAPASFTGYTWSTWSSMPAGVTTSTALTNRTITINATADSKTITANYTANVYNITYKDKGNVAYSGNVTAGVPTGNSATHTYGSATALANGTKIGYDFGGWYTDENCTVSAGSSIGATAFTTDITLYAKWTLHDYTITSSGLTNCSWSSAISGSYTYTGAENAIVRTVNPSSGYGCPSTITVTMGGAPLSNTGTNTGYTWSVTNGVGSFTLNKPITGDVVITIAAQPMVTWMAGGQVFGTQVGSSGTVLDNPGNPAPGTYCVAGKTFVGWSASEIASMQNTQPTDLFNDPTKKTMPAAGATYYAVFATGSGTPSTSYAAITSDIASGDYVIAYKYNTGTQIVLKNAADGTNTSTMMEGYALALSNSKYSNPAADYIWQLQAQQGGGYYIYNLAVGKYLAASNLTSSPGTLQFSNTPTKYDITYDGTNSRWTIQVSSSNTYYVHGYVNGTAYDFRVSTSGSGSNYKVYLYKNEGSQTFSAYATTCAETYDITLAGDPAGTVAGGTFETSMNKQAAGQTVTLTPHPALGYVFGSWTVTKTESPYTDITSTNVVGNTLTMPAYAVTVNATFTPTPELTVTGGDLSETTLPFGTSCEQDEGTDKTFVLNGYSLTNDVTLSITGTDASMFSVKSPSSPISKGSGRITDQTVTITFTPTSTGAKTATLTISSTGATSKTITLSGTAVKHYKVHYWNSGEDIHQESVLAGADATATWDGVGDEDGCDAVTYKYFFGWSKTNIGSTPTSTKPTIGGTYASVSADVNYYAVWTNVNPGGWERYESSTLAEGDYLIVQKSGETYYTMKNSQVGSNPYRMDHGVAVFSGSLISAPSSALSYDLNDFIWHIAESSTSGYYTIYNADESKYVAATGVAKDIAFVASPADDKELFSFTYSSTYKTYNWTSKYNTDNSVNAHLRDANSGWACYAAQSNDSYLYYRAGGTAKYITNCCDKNVTLADGSPSHGTITFDPVGPVETCSGSQNVTMTITPDAGYYLSDYDHSGVNTSNSPTIATSGSTSEAAQEVTLTFAKNTTSGTYTADATFSAILLSSLNLHALKKDNTSATIFEETGNNIALSLYPTEGKTASPADVLGHTVSVKAESDAALPANALDRTYTWSATVNGVATAFDGNALTTNSVIDYNKSTGKLVAKAAGTAEIIITANDASALVAKVTVTVTNVALSTLNVGKSSTTLYVGESEEIAVTYDPVNTTTKGYTTGSYTYVTIGRANDKITLTGKTTASEVTERVTLTSSDAGAKTATIDVTVKPLPKVTFVDIVHNKQDFTTDGEDLPASGIIASTASAGVITHNKKSPTRATDVTDPGVGHNECEREHLHLVGWIRSDYDKVEDYLDGTGSKPTISQIRDAGNDPSDHAYFLAPNVSLDVRDFDGKTFYAVWAKVE